MNALYVYEARLAQCELFALEPFKSGIPNAYEIILNSKPFNTYDECSKSAMDLLSTLASTLEHLTEKRFVVVTKLNPMHDPEVTDKSKVDSSEWNRNTVVRMYIANADILKLEHRIDYSVHANISISQEGIELMHSRAGQYLQ